MREGGKAPAVFLHRGGRRRKCVSCGRSASPWEPWRRAPAAGRAPSAARYGGPGCGRRLPCPLAIFTCRPWTPKGRGKRGGAFCGPFPRRPRGCVALPTLGSPLRICGPGVQTATAGFLVRERSDHPHPHTHPHTTAALKRSRAPSSARPTFPASVPAERAAVTSEAEIYLGFSCRSGGLKAHCVTFSVYHSEKAFQEDQIPARGAETRGLKC